MVDRRHFLDCLTINIEFKWWIYAFLEETVQTRPFSGIA